MRLVNVFFRDASSPGATTYDSMLLLEPVSLALRLLSRSLPRGGRSCSLQPITSLAADRCAVSRTQAAVLAKETPAREFTGQAPPTVAHASPSTTPDPWAHAMSYLIAAPAPQLEKGRQAMNAYPRGATPVGSRV